MTTETEALRAQFERAIINAGRNEGELIFEAGRYLYNDVQGMFDLFMAGHTAALADTIDALRAENEQLRTENEKLLKGGDEWEVYASLCGWVSPSKFDQISNNLRAENEALREDAERWRHALRCVRLDQFGGFVIHPDDPCDYELGMGALTSEVDAAIDAARGEQP